MSRLAYFLTVLWLSSAAGNVIDLMGNIANSYKKMAVNEIQAAADPWLQAVATIGGSACQDVKKITGVSYDNFEEEEPDMSKLNIVVTNGNITQTFNLSTAVEEIPKQSWYDPTLPASVYLHGFTDDPSKSGFQTMQAAFGELEKAKGKVNIFALDASSLIRFCYLRAATMVQFIGEKLGATMARMPGVEPKNIHLVGHSLGSHIAGFAGQQFFLLTGSKIGRITGLDPASPCFAELDDSWRLSENDAEFVDVIHTDAGVFGMKQSIGHADFYPNNGEQQPGCLMQTCSHSRAWIYFAESVINPSAFLGVKCNSFDDFRRGLCDYDDTRKRAVSAGVLEPHLYYAKSGVLQGSIMGYHTTNTARGNYYLITNAEEPYGAGIEGLTYKNNGILRTMMNAWNDLFG